MGSETSPAYKRKQSRDPAGKFAAGDSARFNGEAADKSVSGSMDVKVTNPWSNKHLVTSTDSRGQPYEGAYAHIPTATVERPARTGSFPAPAKQFEAYHHTLTKL
jgi:hypothetical protein